ncbi:transmembrane protein 42a [Stegostoma tigrinum]|uniref:transmembrane protein 42a n=1 Tax=Stegostoma tigrinum TaxID=3053191 RepID=UPI00202B0C4D|nr:transmembrane protein 42a [Stegostoma tigrinum]
MPAADGSGSVTGPALALALAAGSLGALASTAAKLSLGAGNDLGWVDRGKAEWLHILLQVGCGGMAFLFNALMWTFFAKALRYSSSARVSVTTIASNFLSSAFLGKLLFGEVHEMLWWIGITITLCGLLLLHTVKEMKVQSDDYKKEE